MRDFLRRYKWYLIASLVIYLGVSIWLFFATDQPQAVPFQYQVF
jgi:hypothetical protein